MARLSLVPALALGLAAAGMSPAGSANASAEDTASDSPLYAKGKASFRKRCARCHGVNMVNPGAGIYDLRTFPTDEQARFIESVTHGKNAMPSWQDVLGPEDIEALWIYVSSGPTAASP